MEFKQQEMIPKSPRDRALALLNWARREIGEESVSFEKKLEKHADRMRFLEERLEDAKAVLRIAPDADGVVESVLEETTRRINNGELDGEGLTVTAGFGKQG